MSRWSSGYSLVTKGPGITRVWYFKVHSRVVDSVGSIHPGYLGVHRFCSYLAAITTGQAIASLPLLVFSAQTELAQADLLCGSCV